MKNAWERLGALMGLAMVAGATTACGGDPQRPSDEVGVLAGAAELGESCESDGDCLSGICEDVSGEGAICLHDVQGDVVVTCLQDDGTFACAQAPFSDVRFVRVIDGSLQVGYVTESVEVVLPNLREVTGDVVIGESAIATDVQLDGLVSVGGRLEVGFSSTPGVSLASLEWVGSSFVLASMSDAVTISLPSLQSVGSGGADELSLWNLGALIELDAPALTQVDGNLRVSETPVLSEGSLAALDAVEVTGTRSVEP